MPRSLDLDTVAPDDPVVTPEKPTPASEPKPIASTAVLDSIYGILGHTKTPLSSLLVNPKVFDFSERDNDEKILVVARQHWFTNIRWVIATIFMLSLSSLFVYLPSLINLPPAHVLVARLFWFLVTFAYAFEKFLSWYFNVYIITTKRVIDIDFNNLLSKKYSEAGIDQIQDVTSEVIGAFPTLFNYGNVLIQTASEVNELEFGRVANPEKIIKVLQELRDHTKGGTL